MARIRLNFGIKKAFKILILRALISDTEGVGFEPTVHFRVHTLSKRAPSATQTPFQ
jgi:hypothetical protein